MYIRRGSKREAPHTTTTTNNNTDNDNDNNNDNNNGEVPSEKLPD